MTPLLLVVLAARPVAFDDAVTRALAQHPAMAQAQADVARADAQLEQARAPSLPTLGVNAVGTQLDADRQLSGRVLAYQTSLSANAQLQVPLFVANRWAAWRRADANADAARLGSVDARRQVAVAAGRAWLQTLAQQRVVQAQQRSVDTAQAHLDFAQARFKAGLGSELDALRAAQEVAVAKQQLASATGALRRFEELLGVAVGVDEALSAEDSEPDLDAKGAPADGAARTDVKAAQARLDAAHVATTWDWSDYTPLLTAVVQPGYQNPATPTLPTWNLQAQLILSIPLYDGGLRYGQEKERRAIEAQQRAQFEAVQRQANAEVRAALAQVRQADEALSAARDAATQAKRTLELSQQALRAGASTNIEVVDAERRSRDAETAVALAEDAARQARLEVLAASGRFPAAK